MKLAVCLVLRLRMRGAVPTSPPSFYLHGMAFNYVQDKLMLSNDFPSFESTMSVCRPMLVCHMFTVGMRGWGWSDELVRADELTQAPRSPV